MISKTEIDDVLNASILLSRLSFLGACLVVALHVDPGKGFLAPLYRAAVPMFFMMSGYWLVGHVEEKGWWAAAVVKRVKTLVIPYFFWITVTLGVLMVLKYIGSLVGLPVAEAYSWRFIVDSYGWNLCEGVPANMWYVRCLYIFVLLSAGVVALVRKSWILGAMLAVAAMLLPRFVHLPLNGNFWYFGFNAIGFGWFVIGIILRLAKSDQLLLTIGKWGGAVIMLGYAFDSIPLVIVGLAGIAYYLPIPKTWGSLSFPIFAQHGLVWLILIYGFRMVHLDGYLTSAIGYLSAIALTVGICVVLTVLVRKFVPLFSNLIYGGR